MTKHISKPATRKLKHRISKGLTNFTRGLKSEANVFMKDFIAKARKQSLATQGDISKIVSKKPIKSLSIALVTGAVIGYFIHR